MNICPNCQYRGEERRCPHDGYPLVNEAHLVADAAEPDLVGHVFHERYQVVSLLGRGGMGWVFRAQHISVHNEVALKVMRRDLTANLRAIARFYREVRACSQLEHPHTIRVYDFGQSDEGYLYFAMEYLRGRPLKTVLREDGPLAPARACAIARQICQALDEAHDKGVIHRDLKPDNIFLCEVHRMTDWVKVLDFGIAKFVDSDDEVGDLTRPGVVVGTPRYLSPEQAQALPVDRRADLYSLGVILHEMLTGRVPFEDRDSAAILLRHINETAPALPTSVAGRTIPQGLRSLVAELLQKNPVLRPATAAEVERRLELLAPDGSPASVKTAPTPVVPAPVAKVEPRRGGAAVPGRQSGFTDPEGQRVPTPTTGSQPAGAPRRVWVAPPLEAGPARGGRWITLAVLLACATLLIYLVIRRSPGDVGPEWVEGPGAATAGFHQADPTGRAPSLEPTPIEPSRPDPTPVPEPGVAIPPPSAADVAAARPDATSPVAGQNDASPGQPMPAVVRPSGPVGAVPLPTAAAAKPGAPARPAPAAVKPAAAPVAPPPARPVPAVAPAAAPKPAPKPPPARGGAKLVRVETFPAGAQVLDGDAVLGDTPLDLYVEPGRRWRVQIVRPGYRSTYQIVTADKAPRIGIRLVAAPKRTRPTASGGSDGPKPGKVEPPSVQVPYDL